MYDEEPPQSKHSSTGKFVVFGLILALAGLGFWYITRDTGLERATAPTPAPTSTPRAPTTDIPEFEPLTGSLEVTANVDGATVYLDGEALGAAPVRREQVSTGRHSIRVEAPGFQTFERPVNINSGLESQVQALLEPAPVQLRVESDVPGASVFVDRRYIGTTPLTVDDLGPGRYDLTVSAEGYD
ncbi:MAG: PEGA domain-containing protein, partial [Vicinamibacteria bacterium]